MSRYSHKRTLRPRPGLLCLALCLVVAALAVPVFAQTTWQGGTGNWDDPTFWDPGAVPDATTDVLIDGGETGVDSVVNVNVNAAVRNVTIDAGDELNINDLRTLTIHGSTVLNNGTLSLKSLGSATTLRLANDVTFTGGGVLSMGNHAQNLIYGSGGVQLLTNASGHTIRGSGSIGSSVSTQQLGLLNQGLIDANQTTALNIRAYTAGGQDPTNIGVMQASNGGTLNINSTALTNTGGTIQALDGSIVNLSAGSITGGTLTTVGSGVINLTGSVLLNTLFLDGNVRINDLQTASMAGTITNQGTLSLNSTGSATTLRLAEDATLIGGGVLSMGNHAQNLIYGSGGVQLLTNASGHTIRGSGSIGSSVSTQQLGLLNQGLIDANQTTALNIRAYTAGGQDPTNIGVMQASNGGTLNINSTALTNTGGTIQALDGSIVNLSAGSVTGGTLITVGSGVINLTGSVLLNTLFLDGNVRINDLQTASMAGTITNQGTLSLNSTGSATTLNLANDVTLEGSGSILLSAFANNRIQGTSGSDTTEILTNTANHTIRGSGIIGTLTSGGRLGLINHGLIDANQTTALTLELDPAAGVARINTGTLQASNGGTLNIQGGELDNTGGRIQALEGSIVNLRGRVTSGLLDTTGTGVIALDGGTLDTLTNTGWIQINDLRTGTLAGTITNQGTLSLNSTGSATTLRLANDVTLEGSGSILLSAFANNRIQGTSPFGTTEILTNTESHSIRGSGTIGTTTSGSRLGLINQGLIDANQSTALTLELDTAEGIARINTGILQASNEGTLNIQGGALDNTGGLIQALGGSVVNLRGDRVTSGLLDTTGTGVIALDGATLDTLTSTGQILVDNNRTGTLAGTITNQGTLSLNSTGSATTLRLANDVTLEGSGSILLSAFANNRIQGTSPFGTTEILTNTESHSIRGSGTIGTATSGSRLGLINQGLIEANQNNRLVITPMDAVVHQDSGANMLNTGTLRASGIGGVELTQGNILNLGTVEALNNSNITYTTSATTLDNNAGVLESGTWRSVSTGDGATITIRGAAISQIGENAEVVLSGAGSVFQVASTALESSLTDNSGTLRILDNRNYTTTNDLANAGLLQLGGGTLNTSSLTTTGNLTGYGTVIPRAVNSGLIEATGGTLAMTGGIQGGGTVTIRQDGALDLSSATQASSAEFLNHQGTASDSLNLGNSDFIVSRDYSNANFGVGNAFDRRANVIGSGQIIGENASMTITGAVTGTGTDTFVLDLGNLRGGTSTTVEYQVANIGTGADIRGAVQTAAGAGNITDTRLSGSGVTAGNFGPIEAGGDSGNLSVTFTATSGGSLDGQTIGVISNFDNVAGQTIQITGMASALAQGSATPAGPIELGSFRVGTDGPTQSFAVENTTSGPGAEQLGIGSAVTTGNFAVTNNLGSGLIAGDTSQADALSASVSGGVAGINTGALNIQYTSDGTLIDSSFTAIDANSQSITLSATGYNIAQGAASPDPVLLANQRIGGTASQLLTVSNTAPTGEYTEALNASFGASTGDATDNAGNVSLLVAGASDSTSLSVGVDTSVAGERSGTVTLNYVTDGTGTSGLGTLAVGNQTIDISGNVYQVAQGNLVDTTSLNFGVVQVGEIVSQDVSIRNIATGPIGFVEDLNASFGDTSGTGANLISGTGTISGLVAGATDTGSMVVSVDTSSAGTVDGAIAVNYFSAGTVGGVSNGLDVLSVGSQDFSVFGAIETTVIVVDQANPVITTIQPIVLGNVRIDSVSPSAFVSVTNVATGNDQAALNAAITGNAPVTASGSFNLLDPGETDATSLQVGMNTAAAGAIDGTATIAFVSDAGNHGGGQLPLPSQDVQVTGAVFRLAQGAASPDPVAFGNLRVGTVAEQSLSITNTAANDGYSEALNTAFTGASGDASNNAGSVALLGAGATNSAAMAVSLDTSAAGVRSGTVSIGFESDGTGTTGEAAIGVGTQNVQVTGTVFNIAQGAASPDPVMLANQRIGGTASQLLTVSNTAPAGEYTEALNASFGASTGDAADNAGNVSLLVAGASDSTSLSVGVDTSVAGARSGTVTLNYATDGTGTSGLGTLAVGSQTIEVSGNVYQVAAGQLNTASLNFGVVQVGESISQTLSVSNIAGGPTGFVEDLNVSFGDTSGAGANLITGSGAITGLLAGGTDATSMLVSVDTGSAGTVNGAIALNYFSAGTVGGISNGLGSIAVGSDSFGVVGTIETTGLVVDQAVPVINTLQPVVLGNVRQGVASPTATISVTNQATGNDQAGLNAAITGNAPITASGSFEMLLPGDTDATSLQVGMSTATAGAIDGTATIAFVSDAGNFGGSQLALPSQDVQVTGAVYRLADPVVDTAQPVILAARVGDAAPSQNLQVANQSPDAFTEGLRTDIGTVGTGFTGAGNIVNLEAGGTDSSSLSVGLASTSVSQDISGSVTLDFQSTGAGTTGAEDIAVGSAAVQVQGRVYQQAEARVDTPSVNFGIVHVGEAVLAQSISVTNAALAAALNDTLSGGFVNLPAGPFDGSGSVSGLGASQTDGSSLQIGLDTGSAGTFDFSGQYLQFASQNPDMADLDLGTQGLSLFAQVNNFANPWFTLDSGLGNLSVSGLDFIFDYGILAYDLGLVSTEFSFLNDVTGPADLLRGSYDLGGIGMPFMLGGFDDFDNLAAGAAISGLNFSFNTDALGFGSFQESIALNAFGFNASGFEEEFAISLTFQGTIREGVEVNEPPMLLLMLMSLLSLVGLHHMKRSRNR